MINRENSPIDEPHAPVFTIGVVAEMLDVSVPTIRKYEDAHLIVPYRTESNHRRYSPKDVEILKCVRHMIEDFGVSISGIGRLLALLPCWEIRGCSEEDRRHCDAYYNEDIPCWSARFKQGTCIEDECRECAVYDKASRISHIKDIIKSL